MKVTDPISFKAIYSRYNEKYSPKQYSVKMDIVKKLRRPYKDDLTYEKFYENRNKSFSIKCSEDESVTLSILNNARKEGADSLTYSGEKVVGKYDVQHLFNVDDLKTNFKDFRDIAFAYIMSLLFFTGVVFWGNIDKQKSGIDSILNKYVPEAVDSIKNNSKTLINDTIKIIK